MICNSLILSFLIIVSLLVLGGSLATTAASLGWMQKFRRGALIDGTNEDYELLIKKDTSRPLGLFVLWTTQAPEVKCPMCGPFEIIFSKAAKQFYAQKSPNTYGFMKMELRHTESAFKARNMQMVPALDYYPPCDNIPGENDIKQTQKNQCSVKVFNPREMGFTMAGLKEFVGSQVGPLPASRIRMVALLSILIVIGVLTTLSWDKLIMLARNEWLSSIFCTVFVLVMLSGFMWCRIRNPGPFLKHPNSNKVDYIAKGTSIQYSTEAQIVFMLNLASVIALLLCVEAPQYLGVKYPQRRLYVQYTSLALFLVFYSLTLMIFRFKNGTYPYKIFF